MGELSKAEMTPVAYLKIFFRRKEFIIIPMFIGLILGICAGIVLPKKYVSSTILLVEEGKSDNPLFNDLAVSSTVRQRMTAIKESMLGWNSLVKLVKRLGLDKTVKTPKELEGLIMSIRDDINIRLRGPNIIDLSYEGEDPEATQAIVRNITEIFIERNVEIQNKETADAIAFIEEQLKVYQGKIKSSEIAQLRDQLNELLVDATDQHPLVKSLREQIAAKQEELRKQNLEYTENYSLGTNSTNAIIDEIKSALDNIEGGGSVSTIPEADSANKDYYKVLLIDKLDSVMARDAGVNNGIYNMLLQRLETAKITQRLQSSKEGTRYTVLDPPRLPLDPTKPNKTLVALIGLVLGAVLGFGLVVASEFLDKSFIDVEDAKSFLGRPLIGAISKITTEDGVRQEREKQAWLYSLTILGGVIIVILTTAIANFLS